MQKKYQTKQFLENLSATGILGSFYIFNCRNQENWEDMEFMIRDRSQILIQTRNHVSRSSGKICDFNFFVLLSFTCKGCTSKNALRWTFVFVISPEHPIFKILVSTPYNWWCITGGRHNNFEDQMLKSRDIIKTKCC